MKASDDISNADCVKSSRNHKEEAEVREFLTEKDYSFPIAPDPQGEIFCRFANEGIPRNVVIGADGAIIYQSLGYQPSEFDAMIRAIEAELENK